MKISVLGKSGPSVVILGLVCAKSPVDPLAAATMTDTTMNNARKILEPGDLEQGLKAASAVGDDTLQRREQGTVVPDSFTHGTSAQRVGWFRRGFDSGKIDNCDTFHAGPSP